MDIGTLRQIVREESPSRLELGTVVAADPRGTRLVAVRLSGGKVCSRALTCLENLSIGDRVLVAHLEGEAHVVVLSKIESEYGSNLGQRNILAPPANLAALPIPGAIKVSWDDYPGEDLCWEVRHNSSAADAGATDALVTGGGHYFYNIVDADADAGAPVTRYFRVRAIRWIGDNNVMYSAWSSWVNATTVTWDGRYRTETELASVVNALGASLIGIEDAGAHYAGATVEAALQEIAGGGGAPAGAQYVVMALSAGLTAERVLTAGVGITLADGGANGNATVGLDDHDHTGDVGDGAKLDHGAALNGLGDDDHTQYLLEDGSRGLSGPWDPGQVITLPNAGLHLLDTGGNHDLIISPGTDLGADRILTLTTGDAARTITLSGDPTLADWFDQSVKAAATPSFGGVSLPALTFDGASGANVVTVPDNLADALHVVDAGGIEYLKVISTDGQPVTRFNDAGADVDFEVEASGVADAFQVQGADGQITLGALGAGFTKSSAGGVLSVAAEVALVELASYAQGSIIRGGVADWEALALAAAAGCALVSTATDIEWDQSPAWTGPHAFEAGLTVTQGQSIDVLSGAVTVGGWVGAVDVGVGVTGEVYAKGEDAGEPNAIMTLAAYKHDDSLSCTIELYSETGVAIVGDILQVTDYVRALGGVHVGAVADPGTDNLWVDGYAGIGTAPSTAYHLAVVDTTLNTAAAFRGIYASHTKTAGGVSAADYYGMQVFGIVNEAAGGVRDLVGLRGEARLLDGTVSRDMYGGYLVAQMGAGVVTNNVFGMYYALDLNDGDVGGNAFGLDVYVDIQLFTGAGAIGGNVYGQRIWIDVDTDPAGSAYALYIDARSHVDYGIYVTGGVQNYFASFTGFGTVAPGARVEVNGDAADDPLVILDALDDADSAFIDFKGATAATCTASVSLGAVGLFNIGTHIKIKLNGAVRYLRTYICS